MTGQPDWSDRDAAAEYLAEVALELAVKVRENNPVAAMEWLRRQRIPPGEWPALAVIMAAHIDVDRSQSELIGWALDVDDPGRWRAAKAAYERLRSAGLPIPLEVRQGESRYSTALRRAKARAASAQHSSKGAVA